MYDTQIGRWHAVDTLADLYQSYSHYNYVLNNPLKNVDLDGKVVKFAPLAIGFPCAL
jgi:RHS repeat-associated protein